MIILVFILTEIPPMNLLFTSVNINRLKEVNKTNICIYVDL